jgi:phage baseplate assembly protein W
MARSDRYTGLSDKPIFYADFTNNLDLNPLTGYLAKTTNENAVKNSVKNLVLTGNGERFFNSTIGSKMATLLFEPIDPVTAELVRTTIEESIENHEPRARLVNIDVQPNAENNAYYVKVVFKIINIPEEITLNLILNRVR